MSEQEFRKFMEMHYADVLYMVRASVHDKELAEDIVQETFLEAWRKQDIVLKHANPMGWLRCTSKFKMLELKRKLKQDIPLEIEDEIPSDNTDFDMIELKESMVAALSSDEELRFKRYYFWGYSIEQMAYLEQTTVQNERVKLSRLKRKIKQSISIA